MKAASYDIGCTVAFIAVIEASVSLIDD